MGLPIRTRYSGMEGALRSRGEEVEDEFGDDVDLVSYLGPIDDEIGVAVLKSVLDTIQEHKPKLLLNLETYGGYVESAERMANIFRHHYGHVDFAVTTHAISAGTVLVMSGDRIWMDYAATLGPIDPQTRLVDETWLPALGYLEQYERLIKRSRDGTITPVEEAFLIEKFDPAQLYMFEQARALSVALIEDWLVRYKFREWTVTQTRGMPVTDEMRKERAAHVANMLNDTGHWHSHSRGISRDVIERELYLQIEHLDSDEEPIAAFGDALRQYNESLFDYRAIRGHELIVIESKVGYFGR